MLKEHQHGQKEGEKRIAALCKAGIALGVFLDDPAWQVYKTFICHHLKHEGQKEEEQKLQEMVRNEVYGFIKKFGQANDVQYKIVKGGLEEIFGSEYITHQTFKLLSAPNIRVNTIAPGSHKKRSPFVLLWGCAYRISDKGAVYFITCTVVNWVDVFTRKQ